MIATASIWVGVFSILYIVPLERQGTAAARAQVKGLALLVIAAILATIAVWS